MLIAGFDTETTGLVVEQDHIIQVGLVLWETTAKQRKAKMKKEWVINEAAIPERWSADAEAVHGFSLDDLRWGIPAKMVLAGVTEMFNQADAVCAHNGNTFDLPMYLNNCKRYGVEPANRLWIDTTCDIDYPPRMQTRKLTHLAAEHGFLNPFPHDAISDVLTMLKIADLYDWDKTLAYAKAPTLVIRAETSFQQKELAKKQYFRWDADNKQWIKSIKDFQLEDAKKAAADAGFKITVVKGVK